MKIEKATKIVTEEIEVKPGVYYYEDDKHVSYKMVLIEMDDNDSLDYMREVVRRFSVSGITIAYGYYVDGNDIHYCFKQFLLGEYKALTEEEYNKTRAEVLTRLQTN